LPAGRAYESPDMFITISPSVRRMLIELATGHRVSPLLSVISAKAPLRTPPAPPATIADRASELLGASSVLQYVRGFRTSFAPEAGRLTARIQSLMAELIAAQNADGGWPWVTTAQLSEPNQNAAAQPSDRLATAAVVWALASAESLGLLTDVK